MKSKTKYHIEDSKIKEIFLKAKLGNVSSVNYLESGEFNSAYFVLSEGKEYVIKIAPKESVNVLTYEQNMIEREVDFYKLIAEQTNVRTPFIYHCDTSKQVIPSAYFIMERLSSKPLTECNLEKSDRVKAFLKVGEMVADLHNIKGSAFGYEQNGLHLNWYLAIKSMVNNLIEDCKKYNKKAKKGYILLDFIDRYKDILINVESTYVHFDIWDGNIFYQENADGVSTALIDTERGFWGDSIGDFVSIETFNSLKTKVSITTYNQKASVPIRFTKDELIRFNVMRAYLGLIMYSEKFVRYSFWDYKYIFNIFMSKYLINKSFKCLNNNDGNC